mgnify:CR=1 FL=1|jgi:uncharacterized protein (TIRG00374 family)
MSSTKLNFKTIVNRLILFISFGVMAHIIFVLATTERSLLTYLTKLSFGHISIILGLMIFPWIGYAFRVVMWSSFLKEKITFADALRVVVTADLASALSPTAVGGAPVKAALLLNRGFRPGSVGFMLSYGIIEDIIFYTTGIVLAGFFSAGLLSSIGQGIGDFIFDYGVYLSITIILILLYLYLLKTKKIPVGFRIMTYLPEKFKMKIYTLRSNFSQSLIDMKSNFKFVFSDGKLRMLIGLFVLFLQWMSKFSVLLVILHAFNIDFETIQIYIRQWVVYVTMLFIPTPGASGGAEASFLLIFGKSIPSNITYLVVSVWRLFTYYFILLTAVFLYTGLTFLLSEEEDVVIDISESK